MPRISAEKRAKIVAAYLENDRATYKDIGERFGISHNTISKIIKAELEAGNGIKPDRRVNGELTDDELDRRHAEVMCLNSQQHAEMTTWMEHVTPLHQHKLRLEAEIAAKQEALDKAKQEYRNFLATVKQLMEDTT